MLCYQGDLISTEVLLSITALEYQNNSYAMKTLLTQAVKFR